MKRASRSAKRTATSHAAVPDVVDADLAVAAPRPRGNEHGGAPYDEMLLDRARTQWQFADWESLRAIEVDAVEQHPDRAKLALLAAAGQLQAGDSAAAKRLIQLAVAWGCNRRLVSGVLLSGLHNSLGRAATVAGNEDRAREHFEAAIRSVDPRNDVKLLAQARSVREKIGLGLLPQAAAQVARHRDELRGVELSHARAQAHRKVLDLEVDWLRDRVAALQRQMQLAGGTSASAAPSAAAPSSKPAAPPAASAGVNGDYFGLHGLDRKLEAYVDFDHGFFVELGANDGVSQSNTLHFEKRRGWRGVLIEPILHAFLKCRQNRATDNHFYCAACVPADYDKPYVALTYANLMTAPAGLDSDIADPRAHAESGSVYLPAGEATVDIMAPARTLQSILEDCSAPEVIDLLSLDVEGAELAVLQGLDHQRFRFRFMLIESRDVERLDSYLASHGYGLLDKLSQHDYLFAPR